MMISRLEIEVSKRERVLTSTTSKGNQIKWYKDGFWIKANKFGYEDIAEWAASAILRCSNLSPDMYVNYGLCKVIEDKSFHYNGCYSKNFLSKGDVLITIDDILLMAGIDVERLFLGTDLNLKVNTVVSVVSNFTGLDFGAYLRVVIPFDAFILNEDRHLHNLAVIYNKVYDRYKYCPIFDNGLSLLSDVDEYPQHRSIGMNISSVKAKPFSLSFDDQLKVVGSDFYLNRDMLESFILENETVLGRVSDVIRYQMERYSFMLV